MKARTLALLLSGACSAGPVAPTPGRFTLPEALRCGRPVPETCGPRIRSFPELPSAQGGSCGGDPIELDDGPTTAGQMTEYAAQAKRAFNHEQWAVAAPRLHAVALGRSGDDLGNRQLAEYDLAISLYYLGDENGAADLWSAISWFPHHPRFNESALWLSRLAVFGECVTRPVLEALTRYREQPVARFANPSEAMTFRNPARPGDRERLATARFAQARGFQLMGEAQRARPIFESLLREPHLASAARECLGVAGHAPGRQSLERGQ